MGFCGENIEVRADPAISGNITIRTITGNGRMNFADLDPSDDRRPIYISITSLPTAGTLSRPYGSQVQRTD